MIATVFAMWLDQAGNAVTAAVVAGIVSLLVALLTSVLAFQTKVDEGLREKRIALYKVLWKKTGLLPNWPRRADVTYQHLGEFSEELRKWYFEEGGIFLSHKARDANGALQDTVGQLLTPSAKDHGDPTLQAKDGLIGPNYEEEYEKVRSKCSELRSQLTEDLLSRRGARRWF